MKTHILWFVVIATALCGCADQQPITYSEPLNSVGGVFATLPPAVQNTVRAEAGMAEIDSISKEAAPNVYEFRFRNAEIFPPLYVAADGSVLTSNLTVAVGASEDSIAASTGSEASGVKLDDLPPNVVQSIRHQAPTAEVEAISRLTSQNQVYFNISFKDPEHHPKLIIREDGKLMQ
jgi:hypothetical protein